MVVHIVIFMKSCFTNLTAIPFSHFSEKMLIFIIVFYLCYIGSVGALCGGYEPEACSIYCCCGDGKMTCDSLGGVFPPTDLKPHHTITEIELAKSCDIPYIDPIQVSMLFSSLEWIDFSPDGSCKKCVTIRGYYTWLVKGRAVCPG